MVQQAGGRAERPAATLPPCLALDQNHVEVFLGATQPLGQNAAVALVHKQQNPSGPAAGEVGQQLGDRVALLQIGLQGKRTDFLSVGSQKDVSF